MASISDNVDAASVNGTNTCKLFHALHSVNVLKSLNETRKNRSLCDGIVLVSGEEVAVQKGMLAACSPYFRAVYTYDHHSVTDAAAAAEAVVLDDISTQTFAQILEYIYTSVITLNEENIQDILQAADLLLLAELKSLCCEYLEQCLSSNNCLGIIDFSERYSCPRVLYKAQQYLHEHFSEVMNSEEFGQLSTSKLQTLLQENKLKVHSESTILNAIINWISGDRKQNRTDQFKHLVSNCVRISQLEINRINLPRKLDWLKQTDLHKLLRDLKPKNENSSARGYCDVLVTAGGEGSSDQNDCDVATVEAKSTVRFIIPHNGTNARCEQWLDLPAMSSPRIGHGLVEAGGCLFVIGGRDNSGNILNTGEKFNPETNNWQTISPMSHARVGFGLIVVDDKIYALGGSNNMCDPVRSVEEYSIYTNRWRSLPGMCLKRAWAAYAVVNKKIYVIGGGVMGQIYESVEYFDTRDETWNTIAPMKERRFDARAVSCHGDVYVFGGLRRLECPSASVHGTGMKFCGTEVYSTELQQWTTMMQRSSGMCCMNENSHVDSALYLPVTNEIYLTGDLDIGGVYHHVRALNMNNHSWRGVVINKPHNQRNGAYCFYRLSNSFIKTNSETFYNKNKTKTD
ncbi:gigaxonin-like [Tubulanus polymorphus]|uniref:gigaxonin-like n=1 Tax=Tubulanus polymorphus TaxID=672921 RepID=UPI003DA5ED3C